MNEKSMERGDKLTHADLRQFIGDMERYPSIMPGVIYTPGVKYVADNGGAYWLVDAIASYFLTKRMKDAIAKDNRLQSLQFWRLEVQCDGSAVLSGRADSNVAPFVTQHIPFTDFPLEYVEIWAGYDQRRWTLYLPSEH